METTEAKHVRAARKTYSCTWCCEKIEAGSEYWTWFTYGENTTARLHDECYQASLRADLDDELPPAGTYRRGCWCGEKIEHCRCKLEEVTE